MNEIPTLSRIEVIKAASRGLRGTIAAGLDNCASGAVAEEDTQILKFHGIYQQDDRDQRPERAKKKMERAFQFMARLRLPAGVLSPAQWLALDRIGTERGNGTLRLTSRQSIQFHGVIKSNLRPAIAAIEAALLDTKAACGDVNRNVIACANPWRSAAHEAVAELARALSAHLTPRSRAWHEIFVNGEKVAGGEEEEEPIYGATYLPRKFKIAIALPPRNDVDVFAHDLGFIGIVEAQRIVAYNVTVGGGMGATHGLPTTFPRLADVIGNCAPEEVLAVAEAVVTAQRDLGNRADRSQARLKYTLERIGLQAFRAELERRAGLFLGPARPFAFSGTGDELGWVEGKDGASHFTLYIPAGRVVGELKTALAAIARAHEGMFILTPNQNLVIAHVRRRRADIEALLTAHGLANPTGGLRRNALACVALPTCGLALAEGERYLPNLIVTLEPALAAAGLTEDEIVIRMTGCPNGCARPYLGEIGLVGKAPGRYNLYLGAAFDGSRLNRLYREDLDHEGIVAALAPLFVRYAEERQPSERFGDWTLRAGLWGTAASP